MSKTKILLPLVGFKVQKHLSIEGQLLNFRTGLLDLSKKPESFRRHVSRLWKLYRHNHNQEQKIYGRIREESFDVNLDENGFFRVEYDLINDYTDQELDKYLKFYFDKSYKEEIKVPSITKESVHNISNTKYMVISDVDDTVLITHATSFLKRIPQTLVRHAFKRKEVSEMSKFYREMKNQGAGFFYVSNSEMNLYWIIKLFLETRKFPLGPIYLRYHKNWRDFLLSNRTEGTEQKKNIHKINRISYLIEKFPSHKFLLIGDSGQKDPYTYEEVAKLYPQNISGVMIRDVSKGKRDAEMLQIKEQLKRMNIPFHIFHDPKEAIRIEKRWYNRRVVKQLTRL
ncbi:phosphatase domain-containing protein [Flammeovirga sp. SubArs3]|uniref:phosphatase domain-containing protein n=1 Tax=Flammeovirga sp. SubArs3 TaxID=2995316 RepID=UPI00248C603C|nr:phosphatase domain-containing protein [Flammeovirga sp. SubArs3]